MNKFIKLLTGALLAGATLSASMSYAGTGICDHFVVPGGAVDVTGCINPPIPVPPLPVPLPIIK